MPPPKLGQVTTAAGGSAATAHKETTTAAGVASAGDNVRPGAAGGAGGSTPHAPIGPKYTLGDIYYKTYTEEARGNAPHQAPWGLKQKDMFMEFASCRDWFLNSFPPGEVKDIQKLKSAFAEEKAAFDAEKKSAEWGREGLKIRVAEELLSKERSEWKELCKKDNQRMYAARSKITDLEAQIATLKKKVEDVEADKEHVEVKLKAQVASKDKDLAAKDVEIAELKRRLHEAQDKSESLEIDLEAERVKVATAEEAKQRADEARDISTSALNIAQNNYAEAQAIVDTLVSDSEWMRTRGVAVIANSILNASEMDTAVAALIDASRAVGHRGGYLEWLIMLKRPLARSLTPPTVR
ncbi:hypothetical protein Hdeb2414_s0219g00837451 [Helianthus debilis subsp. tardiflorus]